MENKGKALKDEVLEKVNGGFGPSKVYFCENPACGGFQVYVDPPEDNKCRLCGVTLSSRTHMEDR